MRALLIKDIISMKSYLKQILIVFVVFIFIFFKNPQSIGGIMSIMLPMMVITSMSYDDYYHWNRYAGILPMKRTINVKEKYVLLLLSSLFGVLLSISVSGLMIFIRKDPVTDIVGAVASGLATMMFSMLVYSIVMPLLYKYGTEKGRYLFIAVMAIPVALIVLGSSLVEKFGISLPTLEQIKPLLYVSPLAIFLILYVSYKISCRIYCRQEY